MRHKTFEEVRKGNKVYSCEDDEFLGQVLDKGKLWMLMEKYQSTFDREDIEDEEDYNWVAILQDPDESTEGYSSLIFNYDGDPSGVYCKTNLL